MRAVVIDPDARTVEARDIDATPGGIQLILGGPMADHYVVPEVIDDHFCYVNEQGITRKQTMWYFNHCMVWGPMIVLMRLGGLEKPASVPVQEVARFVRFS